MSTDVRKLVTLRKVDEIRPIEGADRIVEARVGGWSLVVKKGEFQEGDIGVFFEIDAALPLDNPLFAFLRERGVKTYRDVEVHVLKTAKLRGVFSQGLLLPYNNDEVFKQLSTYGFETTPATSDHAFESMLGTLDFAKAFGVEKYEPPMPTDSSIIGTFPHEARKTDSERVQNIPEHVYNAFNTDDWYATEKLDGTSSTFVKRNGELIFASRNWEMGADSLQGQIAAELKLVDIMPEGAVLQGELVGEGIQGNPLKLQGRQLAVFAYIQGNDPTDPLSAAFLQFVEEHSVPRLDWTLPATIEEAVEQVNGMKSTLNPKVNAEGVVWWNKHGETFDVLGGRANFKAINNKFLLKHGG